MMVETKPPTPKIEFMLIPQINLIVAIESVLECTL